MKLPGLVKKLRRNGKIFARFRTMNVVLFAIVSTLIFAAMLFVLENMTDTVSRDYAELYSSNTAGTLNTYFGSQIALIKKAARSNAVIEWFGDEYNHEKKRAAYEEMMEIIDSLPGKSLYIGLEKSLHEFTVEEHFSINDIRPFAKLDPEYFDDAWYFECIASEKDYLLNVDIDKNFRKKRVWLNYKVSRDDTVYGVICTWLGFSDLVEKLFSEYDGDKVRGLVVDEKGVVHMDSALVGDDNFLHYTVGDDEERMADKFPDPVLLSAFNEYVNSMDGYYDLESPTAVIKMSSGKYRYATIAPIASTTWSVVTFYNASSLFGIENLVPLLIIVLTMLAVFIVATSLASIRLIFEPFGKLTHSIERIKANKNESVYGIDRHDEIGDIANTVQDMKDSLIDALDKVHYDALTGIYNRRFLEENLSRITNALSCSGGVLSVMMVDIDSFKNYNDTYGHDMGDICLKKIANALVKGLEGPDYFAARYGGEEFTVILPNTGEDAARALAGKLLENVNACSIPHSTSGVESYVTVSIGLTTGRVKNPQGGNDYIKRADEALYISKKSGKNKYTFISFDNYSLST